MNHDRNEEPIDGDCRVYDIVERYPETIPIFITYGLHCVGCCISPFHTISDSAREYGVSLDPLLGALNRVVSGEAPAGRATSG
jgi:hybrid cluster-associated redox disulfide protein